MGLQAVRGTTDVLPDEVARWSAVEHAARRLARVYGYRELRTPLIEDAALFLRSVGETTDIVQKEMFRLERRGKAEDAETVLRPEGTAPVVRAYLEHHLHKTEGFVKLFYLGPMFRAERPQKGRRRQFHQYGVEAIGSGSPLVDAEVIALCVHILREVGVREPTVWLSSMGCRDDQHRSAATLRTKLAHAKSTLDAQCQDRFDKNVFRVLDCKNPACQAIVKDALATMEGGVTPGSPFLPCQACEQHFRDVQLALKDTGIPYDTSRFFARGLDYYTRTVFEVRAEGLGAQDAVAAGGRYDHLVEDLGGESTPAVGFAAGIERVLLAAERGKAALATPARRGVYLALAAEARSKASVTESERAAAIAAEGFRLLQRLRQRGVPADMDYEGKSLQAQLRRADRTSARWVAILGATELEQDTITVKDLEQGGQRTVTLDRFVDELTQTMKLVCHGRP